MCKHSSNLMIFMDSKHQDMAPQHILPTWFLGHDLGPSLSLLICKWGQQHGRLSLARGGKAQEGSRAGSAQSFINVRCHYCCCSWETSESIKSQVLCSGLRGLREAPWASISAPWGLRQSPPSLGPGLSGPCWPAHRCWWPGSLGVRIPPPTCPERRDC